METTIKTSLLVTVEVFHPGTSYFSVHEWNGSEPTVFIDSPDAIDGKAVISFEAELGQAYVIYACNASGNLAMATIVPRLGFGVKVTRDFQA